jgi:hypothetical protein
LIPDVRVGVDGERRRASTTSIQPWSWVPLAQLAMTQDAPAHAPSGHRQGWLRRGIPMALGVEEETRRRSTIS